MRLTIVAQMEFDVQAPGMLREDVHADGLKQYVADVLSEYFVAGIDVSLIKHPPEGLPVH